MNNGQAVHIVCMCVARVRKSSPVERLPFKGLCTWLKSGPMDDNGAGGSPFISRLYGNGVRKRSVHAVESARCVYLCV